MQAVEMLMQGLAKTEDRYLLPKSSLESTTGAQKNQRTERGSKVIHVEQRFGHPSQQRSETTVTSSASKFLPVTHWCSDHSPVDPALA